MTTDKRPTSAQARDGEREKANDGRPDRARDEPTKPAGADVTPPDERVDDETGGDQKTTRRQE